MPLPPQFMKKPAAPAKGAKPNPFAAKGTMPKPMAKKAPAKKSRKGC